MTKRKRRGGARAQPLPTTQAGSPGATIQSITDEMKSAVEAGSKTCNAKSKRISSGVLRCTTTALKTRGPTTRSKSRASGGLSGAQSMDMTEDKSAHSPASVSMAGTTSDDTYSVEGNEKRFSTPESTLYSDDVCQFSFPSSDEEDDFLLPLDVIMGLAPMPVHQSPKKNHKPSQLSTSEIPAKKTKPLSVRSGHIFPVPPGCKNRLCFIPGPVKDISA